MTTIFDDSMPPPPVAISQKVRVPKASMPKGEEIDYEPVPQKQAAAPPPPPPDGDDWDSLDSLIGNVDVDESDLDDEDGLDLPPLGDDMDGEGEEGGEDVGLNEVIDAEFVLGVYEIFREQGMKMAHDFDISTMSNILKAVKKYQKQLSYQKTKTDEEIEKLKKLDRFIEGMESSWEKVQKAIQWSPKHRQLFVKYLKHQLKVMLGDTKMGVLAAFLIVEATAISKVFMMRDLPDLDVDLPK